MVPASSVEHISTRESAAAAPAVPVSTSGTATSALTPESAPASSALPGAATSVADAPPASSPATTPSPGADAERRLIELEGTEAQVVVDGIALNGKTVRVKRGSLVEVQFLQRVNAERSWAFVGSSKHDAFDVLLEDLRLPPFVNGQVQLQIPGTRIFKFVLATEGSARLEFHLVDRTSGNRGVDPRTLPAHQTVTIDFEVE